MVNITNPATRVWCGFFTNDFGDEEDIIYAPEDVLERWQYFISPEIQHRLWEIEDAIRGQV